jgi:hypothetical protein
MMLTAQLITAAVLLYAIRLAARSEDIDPITHAQRVDTNDWRSEGLARNLRQ